jgi:uncharacterized protein (DUF305 family)
MNRHNATAMAAFAFLVLTVATASAEDAVLPEKCRDSGMSAHHQQMMMPHDMGLPDGFQKEYMEGMQKTMPPMMEGMMKDDADVGFICGMIAHHMGAIEMSKTVLEYGDNAEAKALAQKIIDAQLKEIKEMTAWVDANVK